MARRRKLGDAEIELMETELAIGESPRAIAAAHGIGLSTFYTYMCRNKPKRRKWSRWTEGEDELVRKNYPDNGPLWREWRFILPNRTSQSIQQRATKLGVRRYWWRTPCNEGDDNEG